MPNPERRKPPSRRDFLGYLAIRAMPLVVPPLDIMSKAEYLQQPVTDSEVKNFAHTFGTKFLNAYIDQSLNEQTCGIVKYPDPRKDGSCNLVIAGFADTQKPSAITGKRILTGTANIYIPANYRQSLRNILDASPDAADSIPLMTFR